MIPPDSVKFLPGHIQPPAGSVRTRDLLGESVPQDQSFQINRAICKTEVCHEGGKRRVLSALKSTPNPRYSKTKRESLWQSEKSHSGKTGRKRKKKGQRISLMNMSTGQTEYRSPQRSTNSIAMIFRKYSVSFRIRSSCKWKKKQKSSGLKTDAYSSLT